MGSGEAEDAGVPGREPAADPGAAAAVGVVASWAGAGLALLGVSASSIFTSPAMPSEVIVG